MGRKRRDQREAIRKQRAKRRKKNNHSGDEDDDSGFAHTAEQAAPGATVALPIKRSEDTVTKPEQSPATTNGEPLDATLSSSGPAEVAAAKKPVDRIERMRLKKQQQKARRKEKKAAREALATAASSKS